MRAAVPVGERVCAFPAPPHPCVAPTKARPVFSPHSKVFSAVISAHNLAVFTRQAGILRRCCGGSGVPLETPQTPPLRQRHKEALYPLGDRDFADFPVRERRERSGDR